MWTTGPLERRFPKERPGGWGQEDCRQCADHHSLYINIAMISMLFCSDPLCNCPCVSFYTYFVHHVALNNKETNYIPVLHIPMRYCYCGSPDSGRGWPGRGRGRGRGRERERDQLRVIIANKQHVARQRWRYSEGGMELECGSFQPPTGGGGG